VAEQAVTGHAGGLCLAIDTASDIAGVALFEEGEMLAETTWRTRQSHSRQLLPAVDWLLGHIGRSKQDVTSIAVCLGPGSYAGMRVGISTAKALAYALEVPLVGIGRLAADALPLAEATLSRVIAVQAAGRAELAYAAYRIADGRSSPSPQPSPWAVRGSWIGDLQELIAPCLGSPDVVVDALEPGDIVCGETQRLDEATVASITAKGCRLLTSTTPRAVSLARLGLQRLERGEIDNPDTLVPLYLRAPAIGPQPPR
jgi:tRNA threonylcarbamoyl adenosine modification protein YeaZ